MKAKITLLILIFCSQISFGQQIYQPLCYNTKTVKKLGKTIYSPTPITDLRVTGDFLPGKYVYHPTQTTTNLALVSFVISWAQNPKMFEKMNKDGVNIIETDDGIATVQFKKHGLFGKKIWWLEIVPPKKVDYLSKRVDVRVFRPI